MDWTFYTNSKIFIVVNVYHTISETIARRIDTNSIKWYESDGSGGTTIKLYDEETFCVKESPEDIDEALNKQDNIN